jgi:predicted dehydrogenase
MGKIRVAVVGVGSFGSFHAEKYANLKNVDLVGVVDIVESKAKEVARKLKTNFFLDYSDVYGQVDAVSIAVPTKFHYQIAKDFLEQDKDVLLEKPITATLEEAEELIQIAEKNERILQIGHLERFNAAALAVGKSLSNPRFIESHRLSSFQGRGTDVDVILDLMIHDIDIILSFVKRKVEFINAVGVAVISPKIDIANARLQFENGCIANITASRISDKSMRKVRIFQPNAYFSLDYATREVAIYRKMNGGGRKTGIIGEKKRMKQKDPLREEISSFLNSVVTRKPPVVSGKEGKEALFVAMKIQEQIHKNGRGFGMEVV